MAISAFSCRTITAINCVLLIACSGNDVAGIYACQDLGFVETIELTRDGRIYTKAKVLGETQQTAGTYEIDGTRLIAVVNGSTTVMDIDNGAFVLGEGKCVSAEQGRKLQGARSYEEGDYKPGTATSERERNLQGSYRIDMESLKQYLLDTAKTGHEREQIREHINNKEAMDEISEWTIKIKPNKRLELNILDDYHETAYTRQENMLILNDKNNGNGNLPSRIDLTDEGALIVLVYEEEKEIPIIFVREN